jgi:hypothetical protein
MWTVAQYVRKKIMCSSCERGASSLTLYVVYGERITSRSRKERPGNYGVADGLLLPASFASTGGRRRDGRPAQRTVERGPIARRKKYVRQAHTLRPAVLGGTRPKECCLASLRVP